MKFPGQKLVEKLWETLAEKGIGKFLTPWQTIREGRARSVVRRNELLVMAQTEVDVADIRAGRKQLQEDGSLKLTMATKTESMLPGVLPSNPATELTAGALASSAAEFNLTDAIRREINVNRAILIAEDLLLNDTQVPSDETINEDWLLAWRDHVSRVSDAQLQQIWARALAGQIKSPARYSLRTLEFLRGLSKKEADAIALLAPFVVDSREIVSVEGGALKKYDVKFELLLTMQELGLMAGVESGGFSVAFFSERKDRFWRRLKNNGKIIVVEHSDPKKEFVLPVYSLTEIGTQVLELGSFQPNMQYMKEVADFIQNQGFTASISDHKNVFDSI